MSFGHGTLTVARPGQRDGIVLVPATTALRLRAQGRCAVVDRQDALRAFDRFALANRASVRAFVAALRLSGAHVRDLGDHLALSIVRDSIRDGRVVGLCRSTSVEDRPESQTRARRRLVRELAARTRERLDYLGRRYRLVADVDLARMPDRDRYEVVPCGRAVEILRALAGESSANRELASLLARAADQLSPDWRPPMAGPSGLVLLRRARVPAVVPHPSPAITPSQLRALSEAGWIEVEFVDEAGRPLSVACHLELPDCTPLDSCGEVVAKHGFSPGSCGLVLPEVDAAQWSLQR
jgi:hypothetical protein